MAMNVSVLRWWLALILLATSLVANAQHGHQHGDGAAMANRDELGSTPAFDAKGTLWVVYKDSGHVVLRHSSDHGSSWSPPTQVNKTAEPIEAGGDARPKLALGPKGEIYVTWTQPLGKPYTGFIRMARSLDGGKTFTTPVTVHANRQEITHRFDSITVTRDGRVFVVWVDKRDGEAARAAKTPYEGAALYFAVSDDRGATFRGDFKLAEHSCECCRIALLPRDDGSVLALWRHVFPSNVRDHAVATIFADGHPEGFRRATFDNWVVDACPHHGPSLAVDASGRLHAVWFDLGPEHSGAFYGVLRDGGVDGLRKIGGETAEHPDLAIAGKTVAIAWKEFDGEKSQLKAMLSDDDGATWREKSVSSSAAPSDQPHLVTDKGKFYVLWNTRSNPLSVFPL